MDQSQSKTQLKIQLDLLARNPIQTSNCIFQLKISTGFPSWKIQLKSNWITRLEIPALKFRQKSQLEVQLDFPTGYSIRKIQLKSDWIIRLEISAGYSSWEANWIFKLKILIEISSGRCTTCFPTGLSSWEFRLVFFSWKSNLIFYLEISTGIPARDFHFQLENPIGFLARRSSWIFSCVLD